MGGNFDSDQTVYEGMLVITFNRPEKLNAWIYLMHGELRRAIEATNADTEIDAIVVTANGKGLGAGADMSAVFGLSEEQKHQARAEAKTHEWVALVRHSKLVIAAEDLLMEDKTLARRMGRNPHVSLRATKQLLTANACENDLDKVQRRELDTLRSCYASGEHKEAVAAFMAKRPPHLKSAQR